MEETDRSFRSWPGFVGVLGSFVPLGDDVEAVSRAIEHAEAEAKDRAAVVRRAADQWAKDLKELRLILS